jgi:hypothetical protein
MPTEQDQSQAEQKWLEAWRAGPQRLRWDHVPLQVGDAAPDLELTDHTGQTRRLSTYWQNGPALILFWRHFGFSSHNRAGEPRAVLRIPRPAHDRLPNLVRP